MSRETAREKGARLLLERKVRLIRAESSPHRHVFHVLGDSADPLAPEPYRVVREWLGCSLVESCTCVCATTRCSHIAAARLVGEATDSPIPKE